ncbi:MAG: sensor histidine kinase [Flammeovirgaceae bacterium]
MRQIRKALGRRATIPEEFEELFLLISESYDHHDNDRYMLERSIDLSSKELLEANHDLLMQKQELENALEELRNTQEQLEESERMAALSKQLADANESLQHQQEELKAAYEDLQSAQTQLVHSEKMSSLGQLTAGVAHEINNPVNFIYGGIQALQVSIQDLLDMALKYEQFMQAKQQRNTTLEQQLMHEIRELQDDVELSELAADIVQMMKDIKIGAERTAEIVRGLQNFSRMDDTNLQIADIHEGINSTLVILSTQLRDGIKVEKEYDTRLEPIQCYPGQLNQVYMNILSNAIQAMDGKGSIKIKTRLEGEQIIISFKDDGPGIPEEMQQKIFDPFYTTKEIGKGTGLGLSITYGIVEKHHGQIVVKSQEGQGAEFIITLPKILEGEPI